MRRATRQDTAGPGHDSFLDIVANIVGILIILVLVTGLRVRNSAVEAAAQDESLQARAAALENDQVAAASLRGDVLHLASQIQDMARERIIRQNERARLATAVAAWEHRIQSHRSELDADAQRDYDLKLDLSEARFKLEQLDSRRSRVEAAKVPTTVVESYPTPLSKTVDDREAHFQLSSGQIVFIPLEELLKRFKDDAQRRAYKLLNQPELTETVGPVDGFRLRYTLERHDVVDESGVSGRMGSYARLKRWTLIPVSGQLGEPVDAALRVGSRFLTALSDFDPDSTTITIWTYGDSFAEFRRLKKELYHLGFPTAARPLPHGVQIGGAPEGSKSAAQ